MTTPTTSILFVCLGNICRSPLAEGVFIHHARKQGVLDRFHIDSCGTGGWHAGEPADPRSIAVAEKHAITLPSRARKLNPKSDNQFNYIIAMDTQNRTDLLAAGAPKANTHLLRAFDPAHAHDPPSAPDVPDPYYGGPSGFDEVFEMVNSASEGLLAHLLSK